MVHARFLLLACSVEVSCIILQKFDSKSCLLFLSLNDKIMFLQFTYTEAGKYAKDFKTASVAGV